MGRSPVGTWHVFDVRCPASIGVHLNGAIVGGTKRRVSK